MNIYDLMDNVRLRLGDPRSGRPGDQALLNAVCTSIRTIRRHQRNTSNPFNFADTIVDIQPDEAVYSLTSTADFGTPLAVLTWDPTNPNWVARLIPFFKPQNMPFDYALPNNAGQWGFGWTGDGSNCTALRCSFYWNDQTPFIEFLPVPAFQCQYKIRYLQSANGINDLALTEEPISNEDADICEVRAALSLLAVTEWNAPDSPNGRAANAERRKDLSDTLQGGERELRRQFEAAQLITTGPRTTVRWSGSDYSG